MKRLLGIFLIAATAMMAQTAAPPLPVAAAPDVLGCIQTLAEPACIKAYKDWAENAIAVHDTAIHSLYSQVAAIPAGPQGIQGPPGPSLNTPQVDSSAIAASTPVVTLVRTLCYPSNAYIGNIPATGEIVDFTVSVKVAGNHTVSSCVASMGGAKTYHFEFPAGTKVGSSITVLNTGSYQAFAYQAGPVLSLPAGQSTVRVVFENGGMNFAGFNYR